MVYPVTRYSLDVARGSELQGGPFEIYPAKEHVGPGCPSIFLSNRLSLGALRIRTFHGYQTTLPKRAYMSRAGDRRRGKHANACVASFVSILLTAEMMGFPKGSKVSLFSIWRSDLHAWGFLQQGTVSWRITRSVPNLNNAVGKLSALQALLSALGMVVLVKPNLFWHCGSWWLLMDQLLWAHGNLKAIHISIYICLWNPSGRFSETLVPQGWFWDPFTWIPYSLVMFYEPLNPPERTIHCSGFASCGHPWVFARGAWETVNLPP